MLLLIVLPFPVPNYTYIKVGHLNAYEIPHLCTLDLIVMTSWQEFKDLNSSSYVSLSQIHQSLLYGFELEICLWCKTSLLWGICACLPFTLFVFVSLSIFLYSTSFGPAIEDIDRYAGFNIGLVLGFYSVTKFIISPLTLWFLIYKFRRRHFSVYEEIEDFLQSNNELTPIRYSYSEIKRMTRGF
ncbi:uncharacterized protein LOC125214071 isoform X2 [Salvia hispanica]|uniref:uncharacterized protein LOC125214071 isoform X2 n=1 Tax=Salvia hispanica TaxID=49212 RepID=UPI002009470A|nr:uncharacterized protein LOC125214071 isoform X2 [Salvia hispanica]